MKSGELVGESVVGILNDLQQAVQSKFTSSVAAACARINAARGGSVRRTQTHTCCTTFFACFTLFVVIDY